MHPRAVGATIYAQVMKRGAGADGSVTPDEKPTTVRQAVACLAVVGAVLASAGCTSSAGAARGDATDQVRRRVQAGVEAVRGAVTDGATGERLLRDARAAVQGGDSQGVVLGGEALAAGTVTVDVAFDGKGFAGGMAPTEVVARGCGRISVSAPPDSDVTLSDLPCPEKVDGPWGRPDVVVGVTG